MTLGALQKEAKVTQTNKMKKQKLITRLATCLLVFLSYGCGNNTETTSSENASSGKREDIVHIGHITVLYKTNIPIPDSYRVKFEEVIKRHDEMFHVLPDSITVLDSFYESGIFARSFHHRLAFNPDYYKEFTVHLFGCLTGHELNHLIRSDCTTAVSPPMKFDGRLSERIVGTHGAVFLCTGNIMLDVLEEAIVDLKGFELIDDYRFFSLERRRTVFFLDSCIKKGWASRDSLLPAIMNNNPWGIIGQMVGAKGPPNELDVRFVISQLTRCHQATDTTWQVTMKDLAWYRTIRLHAKAAD